MKNKITIFGSMLIMLLMHLLTSCEDAPPTEYVPEHYVEAFILVGEPIAGIRVYLTQPTTSKYSDSIAVIRDADIRIIDDKDTMKLAFRENPGMGYFYPDTNYKVKPNTDYKLRVTLKDGKIITGQTKTLGTVNWINEPKDYMYFPKDTLNPKAIDSIAIKWSKVPGIVFYILNVRCLDTLNYGKYLTPATDEMNRRTFNIFYRDNDKTYRELSSINFVGDSTTPVVWMAFKWFGKQEVTVYAPDNNYLKWFKNQMFSQYHDPLMNSVTNAIGVFGSASVVRKQCFLVKNQP